MFEHPSQVIETIAVEQERIDRANELRRFIAEHPERIVRRERPFVARVRSWFGTRRADAATPAAASDGSLVICDQNARPAHAR